MWSASDFAAPLTIPGANRRRPGAPDDSLTIAESAPDRKHSAPPAEGSTVAMGKLFKMKFNECAQDPEVTGKLVSNMTRRPKQRDSEHSFRTRAFRLRLHRPRAPVFAADAPGSCTGSVRILYQAAQDKVAAPRLAAQTFRVFFASCFGFPARFAAQRRLCSPTCGKSAGVVASIGVRVAVAHGVTEERRRCWRRCRSASR